MATINTKWLTSAMAGAPVLSGSAGAMISVLDACLKDGFNLLTLDSLVIASNVATGTKASHGYLVNQVITLSGITGACAALNGDVRIASVTANTFTFATSGLSDQTASGTITAKTPACGWEKQFSGTNLAVYRSGNVLSTRIPIRVDDTVGQYSTVLMAEAFTDISTPVTPCSTQYFKKSNATDANARPWIVIADDKTFYIGVDWNNTSVYDFYSFGDFASFVTGDSFCCRLQGLIVANPTNRGEYSSMSNGYIEDAGNVPVSVAPRSYAQTVGAAAIRQGSLVAVSMYSQSSYAWALSGNHGYAANVNQHSIASPSLADSGYHFVPVFLFEQPAAGRTLRGAARGLLHVVEYLPQASGYSILSGVENVNGALVMMVRSAGYVLSSGVSGFSFPATTLGFALGNW